MSTYEGILGEPPVTPPAVPSHLSDGSTDESLGENGILVQKMSMTQSNQGYEGTGEAPELPKEARVSSPRRLSQKRASIVPTGQEDTEENRVAVMNKVVDLYDTFQQRDEDGDLIVDFHEILAIESGHTRASFMVERMSIQESVLNNEEEDSSDDEMAFGHKEISLEDLQARFVKRLKMEPLISVLDAINAMIDRCKIQGDDIPLRLAPPVPRTSITLEDVDKGPDSTGEDDFEEKELGGSLNYLNDPRVSASQEMDHAPPPVPANVPPSTPVSSEMTESERSLSRNSLSGCVSRSSKKLSFSEVKGDNPHKGQDMRVTNLDLSKVFVVEGKAIGEEKIFSITLFIDVLILKGFYFNPQDPRSYAVVEASLPKSPAQPTYDELYELVLDLQNFHKKQEVRDALWVKLKQEEKDKTCLCMAQWKQDEIEKYMLKESYSRFQKAYERAIQGRRASMSGRPSSLETANPLFVQNMNR